MKRFSTFFENVRNFFSNLNPFGDDNDRNQTQLLEEENKKQKQIFLAAVAFLVYLNLR